MDKKYLLVAVIGSLLILNVLQGELRISDYRNLLSDTDAELILLVNQTDKIELLARSSDPDIEFIRYKYEDEKIKVYNGRYLIDTAYPRIYFGSTQIKHREIRPVTYTLTNSSADIIMHIKYYNDSRHSNYVGTFLQRVEVYPSINKVTFQWSPKPNDTNKYNIQWVHETKDKTSRYSLKNETSFSFEQLDLDWSDAGKLYSTGYKYKNGKIYLRFKSKRGFQHIDPKIEIGFLLSSDTMFTKLIHNKADIDRGTAIYEFYNPLKVKLDSSDFSTDVFGDGVKKFEYYKLENVTTNNAIYITESYDCSTHENGTIERTCKRQVFSHYDSKTSEEWILLDFVEPKETVKIKIIGFYEPGIGTQSRDWIPEVRLKKNKHKIAKDRTVIQTKWAWWNSSYNYSKTITLTDTNGTSHETERIEVNITGLTLTVNCSEVRIVNNNSERIDYRLIGNGTDWCKVAFILESLEASGNVDYAAYYGSSDADEPSYNATGDEYVYDTHTMDIWHLNEEVDAVVSNSSRGGVVSGAYGWSDSGKISGSIHTPVDGAYFGIPDPDLLIPDIGCIEFWMKANGTSLGGLVLKDPAWGGDDEIEIQGTPADPYGTTTEATTYNENADTISGWRLYGDYNWHHYAFCWDIQNTVDDYVRMYVDGERQAEKVDLASSSMFNGSGIMCFGDVGDRVYNFPNAYDEIRLSNSTRQNFIGKYITATLGSKAIKPKQINLYLNESEASANYEHGTTVNITAICNETFNTYLSMNLSGRVSNYTSGTKTITDIWSAISNIFKFNTSNSIESITIGLGVWNQLFFTIDRRATLDTAYINLTGVELIGGWTAWDDIEDNYNGAGTGWRDEDWTTYTSTESYKDRTFIENYTLPASASDITLIEWEFKYRNWLYSGSSIRNITVSFYNFTLNNWSQIYFNGSNVSDSVIKTISLTNPVDLMNDIHQVSIKTQLQSETTADAAMRYYEGKIRWYYGNSGLYPQDILINVGDDSINDIHIPGTFYGDEVSITDFSDGSYDKNVTFLGAGTETVYIRVFANATNITNATLYARGIEANYTQTKLNNTLSLINLTYQTANATVSSNHTVLVYIGGGATIFSASVDISALNDSNITIDTETSSSLFSEGAVDEDWNTFGSGANIFYENYTLPLSTKTMQYCYKGLSNAITAETLYIYFYRNGWVELYSTPISTGSLHEGCFFTDNDGYIDNDGILQVKYYASHNVETYHLYETRMDSIEVYPVNVTVFAEEFNETAGDIYEGSFNELNTTAQTITLNITRMQTYLDACLSNPCPVPMLIGAKGGAIKVNNTQIKYGDVISNLTIDTGADETIDANFSDWFNSTNTPYTFDLNTTAIMNYLATCDYDALRTCIVPIRFSSERAGFMNMNFTINYTVNPIELNFSAINLTMFNSGSNDVDIPLNFSANQSGNLSVSVDVNFLGTQHYNVSATCGTNTTWLNLYVYYSDYSITMPDLAYDYFQIFPDNYTFSNEIPYGQDETEPIFNITNIGYGKAFNLSLRLNGSSNYSGCLNITVGTDHTLKDIQVLNTTYWLNFTNVTLDNYTGLWINVSGDNCDYEAFRYFELYFEFDANCLDCMYSLGCKTIRGGANLMYLPEPLEPDDSDYELYTLIGIVSLGGITYYVYRRGRLSAKKD